MLELLHRKRPHYETDQSGCGIDFHDLQRSNSREKKNDEVNLRGHKNVRNVTKERAKEKTSKTCKELPQNEEEIKCNQRIRSEQPELRTNLTEVT